jgi:protein-disulfide isomerase
MPDVPRTEVLADGMGAGPAGALRVYYFANFTCTDCTAGWQMLRETASERPDRVRAEFRHHLPEGDLAAFTDALEAECAARQGRFWDYGDWRMLAGSGTRAAGTLGAGSAAGTGAGSGGFPSMTGVANAGVLAGAGGLGVGGGSAAAEALALDGATLAQCMADPETAVTVLDDTAEALRLGFREAVPSWVVGARPRRGYQKQDVIDRDIAEQLAAPTASTGSESGRQQGAGGEHVR